VRFGEIQNVKSSFFTYKIFPSSRDFKIEP